MEKEGILEGILFVQGDEGITLESICKIMEIDIDNIDVEYLDYALDFANAIKYYLFNLYPYKKSSFYFITFLQYFVYLHTKSVHIY